MKTNRSIVMAAAISLVLVGASTAPAAPAATASGASQNLKRLKAADRQLAIGAASTKGAPQQGYLLEKKRIDELIDALESGKSVDPAAIDRARERGATLP